MPTDILRQSSRPVRRAPRATTDAPMRAEGERVIVIGFGRNRLRARLRASATADRIWAALPLFSTVEPWGEAVHFEIPVASGRDRSAHVNGRLGEVCFWAEERRIIIAYGATPISRPGEIRMPQPVNVIADVLDDVGDLRRVKVGEKVSLKRAEA